MLGAASATGKPILLIADTIKGFGLEGADDHFSGYHTMSRLKNEVVQEAIDAIDQKLDQQTVSRVLNKLGDLRGVSANERGPKVWAPVQLDITPGPNTPNHPDDCQFDYFSELHKLIEDGVMLKSDLYFSMLIFPNK